MSFDAGAIVGSLTLDLSEFTSSIAQGAAMGTGFGEMLTQVLEKALEAVAEAAKKAAEFLVELVNGSSKAEFQIGQTAKAMGVSVEFLDGWGKAAERAGGQASSVGEMMTHLSRTALEAVKDSTGDSAQAFQALGISVTDANGNLRPMEALMRDMADAMSKMQAGTERNALAQAIFSRSGDDTLAFLSEGSKAIDAYADQLRAWGDLTTDQTAAGAKAWEEMKDDFSTAWEGMKRQLGEPMRDALTPMLQMLFQWVQSNLPQIKAAIAEMAHVAHEAFFVIASAIDFCASHFQDFMTVLEVVGKGIKAQFDLITGPASLVFQGLGHAVSAVSSMTSGGGGSSGGGPAMPPPATATVGVSVAGQPIGPGGVVGGSIATGSNVTIGQITVNAPGGLTNQVANQAGEHVTKELKKKVAAQAAKEHVKAISYNIKGH